MAFLNISEEELKKVTEEAISKDIPPSFEEYVLTSVAAVKDGSRGEAWCLTLIKLLASTVVMSRKA